MNVFNSILARKGEIIQ